MDFSAFKEHLEYWGYKVREEKNEKFSSVFAESKSKANFNLTKVGDSPYMILRCNWAIDKTPDNIYELVNDLNEKAVNISSVWYYLTTDGKPALGISSAYFGEYNKEVFAALIDIYLADISRIIQRNDVKAMLQS